MKYCDFKLNKWFWGSRENKSYKKEWEGSGFLEKKDSFNVIMNSELKIKQTVRKVAIVILFSRWWFYESFFFYHNFFEMENFLYQNMTF